MNTYERCIQNAMIQNGKDRNFSEHRLSDFYTAVFGIHDRGIAKEFYNGYVEWIRKNGTSPSVRDHPEDTARSNIGWMFGEGMKSEDIQMWVEATGAAHPVFGAMANGHPTPEEAFKAGEALGKKHTVTNKAQLKALDKADRLEAALQRLMDDLEHADSKRRCGCAICGGTITHADSCAIVFARKAMGQG